MPINLVSTEQLRGSVETTFALHTNIRFSHTFLVSFYSNDLRSVFASDLFDKSAAIAAFFL